MFNRIYCCRKLFGYCRVWFCFFVINGVKGIKILVLIIWIVRIVISWILFWVFIKCVCFIVFVFKCFFFVINSKMAVCVFKEIFIVVSNVVFVDNFNFFIKAVMRFFFYLRLDFSKIRVFVKIVFYNVVLIIYIIYFVYKFKKIWILIKKVVFYFYEFLFFFRFYLCKMVIFFYGLIWGVI